MPSLFTKIINGEIPSYKVYEDELVFAFLDIFPFQPGHTLIVPKIEVDYFVDVPEPYYTAVFNTAKKLAPAIQKASNSLRVGMMVQGVDVPHFHLHLIPIFENQPFTGKKKSLEKSQMSEIQDAIISYLDQA
jgi:histidine triad (HIT) family protein